MRGMTMQAFGESLGVTYSVISNYELGRVKPSDLFLRHLCSTHNISRYWLDTGDGSPDPASESMDDVCAQLRVVLSGMDPGKVDAICHLVRMPDSWWHQFLHG